MRRSSAAARRRGPARRPSRTGGSCFSTSCRRSRDLPSSPSASPPTDAATTLLDRAVDSLGLSGRGRARVERVAATVAALAASAETCPEHVGEALSYRAPAELTAP